MWKNNFRISQIGFVVVQQNVMIDYLRVSA
jgi:hypothetical protein